MIGLNALLYREPAGGVEQAIKGAVLGLLQCAGEEGLRFFASTELKRALPEPYQASIDDLSYTFRSARIFHEQRMALRRNDIRLWHHLGYVSPFFSGKYFMASVYDVIALTNPRLCKPSNRLFYSIMLPRTLRKACAIIVPSNYVRNIICDRGWSAEERVHVLPLPLPEHIQQQRVCSRGKRKIRKESEIRLLFVGRIEPKKNLPFLLLVLSRMPEPIKRQCILEICGPSLEPWRSQLESLARDLALGDHLSIQGSLSTKDLVSAYRTADILLYPSLDEGFGYPPLEAMALGTPCVVSSQGALPEVAGSCGAIVAPLNVEAWVCELTTLIQDQAYYESCRQRGLKDVPGLCWRDYAVSLLQLYREIAGADLNLTVRTYSRK